MKCETSIQYYRRVLSSFPILHVSHSRNLEFIIKLLNRRFYFSVSIDSGCRRLKKDQLPRLIAKIEEFFPKYAKDKKHVQKIIDIVNCCVYDERLVSESLF